LYERYHTRLLKYYGGLVTFMPIFSTFFLIFTLANIGLPLTSSFIGEFLIILGIFKYNFFVGFFVTIGTVLGACYAVWLANRLLYGNVQKQFLFKFSDLNKREFFILLPLAFLVLIGGIYPSIFFNVFNLSLINLLYY